MPYQPSLWPVSVKAVALDQHGRVVLLRNEREEWELPGGRLEIGPPSGSNPADSSPEEALERELREETGWTVKAGKILDSWVYEPLPGRRVLIVTYDCTVLTPDDVPVVSHEHTRIDRFTEDQVPDLTMPDGYKRSIAAVYAARAAR
ncbi:NUDIX domain-containing protein [Streptomyces sp. NPDC097617]|uniref:NUDIX domain-containing protein n=1 Tax=Streptomyces sp. NPDC097617 TaxID=3366091 RepID=UPI003802FA49